MKILLALLLTLLLSCSAASLHTIHFGETYSIQVPFAVPNFESWSGELNTLYPSEQASLVTWSSEKDGLEVHVLLVVWPGEVKNEIQAAVIVVAKDSKPTYFIDRSLFQTGLPSGVFSLAPQAPDLEVLLKILNTKQRL